MKINGSTATWVSGIGGVSVVLAGLVAMMIASDPDSEVLALGRNASFMGGPGVYEIIPGFILAWIAIMVVSLVTKDAGEHQAFTR